MKIILPAIIMVVAVAVPAQAKKITAAEYIALSAHNAAAVHQREVQNEAAYNANQNPLSNGGLESLPSPYDIADLFYGTNGYILPGWAGFFGSGGGGDSSLDGGS